MGFLIFLSITLIFDLVSADKVLLWTQAYNPQLLFPYHQKEEATTEIEIKNPSGKNTYKIVCKTYAEESPKADIKREDGIIVDSLFLKDVPNPCEEARLKAYVVVNDPDPKKPKFEKLTYLWSSKSPKCITRYYRVNKFRYAVIVHSEDVMRDKCEGPTEEYLKNKKSDIGGVVSVLPSGSRDILDYNAFVTQPGEPKKTPFPTKDPANKDFLSVCREDMVKEKDTESKFITTTIEHEEIKGIVIEKFLMENCELNRININRQTISGATQIQMVFETVPNVCFDRYLNFNKVEKFYYYVSVGIHRSLPRQVLCPKSFVGDISMNENIPWYKRWFADKPVPFAVEIPARDPSSSGSESDFSAILRDTTKPESPNTGYTSLAASGYTNAASGGASKRETEPTSTGASKSTKEPPSADASGNPTNADTNGKPANTDASGKPANTDASGKPANADTSGKPANADTSGKPTNADVTSAASKSTKESPSADASGKPNSGKPSNTDASGNAASADASSATNNPTGNSQ